MDLCLWISKIWKIRPGTNAFSPSFPKLRITRQSPWQMQLARTRKGCMPRPLVRQPQRSRWLTFTHLSKVIRIEDCALEWLRNKRFTVKCVCQHLTRSWSCQSININKTSLACTIIRTQQSHQEASHLRTVWTTCPMLMLSIVSVYSAVISKLRKPWLCQKSPCKSAMVARSGPKICRSIKVWKTMMTLRLVTTCSTIQSFCRDPNWKAQLILATLIKVPDRMRTMNLNSWTTWVKQLTLSQ